MNNPAAVRPDCVQRVGTWLSLVERTLGVGEVASSNLVVPTISSNQLRNGIRNKTTFMGTERNTGLRCSLLETRIEEICDALLRISLLCSDRLHVHAVSHLRRGMPQEF